MTEKELCRECGVDWATSDDALCDDCRIIRDDDFANIGMYVSDSGEVLDIEPQTDFETCWNCGGAFGNESSYNPSHYEICPVCGSILNTRAEDEDVVFFEYFCDYCGESLGGSPFNPCPECGATGLEGGGSEELSEETQPIPPLSERAEVVDDAIREDEIRDLEQAGLAWWLDMPIPFELTPLAEKWLSDHA